MHLYIHIPFCKQACYYCDFHFSTNLQKRNEMVDAICKEIIIQKDYLRGLESEKLIKGSSRLPLQTIYFGGGTPSLLTYDNFQQIFDTIYRYFYFLPDIEITLEANPDDLNKEKLALLKHFPINRLSIGIQSFYQPHLHYLHRAHTADQAEQSVHLTQQAGFNNISIDLIYSIPYADHSIWKSDLQKALQLGVSHISSYCLTIEPQTPFGKWLTKGKIKAIDEEFAAQQFEILINTLMQNGFEQYEISNFALPNHYSRHNTSYWQQKPYLGVGPSAHSYNGITRQYNIANNATYLKAIFSEQIPFTIEPLTVHDHINEYIMTSLRTQWGCSIDMIRKRYNIDLLQVHLTYLEDCQNKGLLLIDEGFIKLTLQGKLLADQIASDMFLV